MIPNSRAAAKATAAKFYFTGLPCKNGHVSLRAVKGDCIECHRLHSRKSGKSARSVARKKEYSKSKYWENSDASREVRRLAYYRNKDAYKRRATERRAYKGRAIPKWADARMTNGLYVIARRISECTGMQWHVDHIVPLKGRTVCGLHSPENLRVIPATLNMSKGARWEN